MSVSENLKNAVAEHDIDDVRGGLWSCIAVDMNMTGRFKESLEYALANGIDASELYEEDDGKLFETEASIDNFSKLGGGLRVNFSKKKLDALRTMGRTLYPPTQSAEEPKKNSTESERRTTRARKKNAHEGQSSYKATWGKQTIGGAATGGTVIGLFTAAKRGAKIGGVIGGGLVGACIGACVGAAVVYMLFREK
ncbi:MAG: hypothetical protein II814_10910 [Treponema sp.]|nr:hypothetical protein [Treponema sp.]